MGATQVWIRPVRSRRELSAFVDLPWRLYRGDSFWVPPLKKQVRFALDPRHPFYHQGRAERELFLAWRDGQVVGRVAAILNRAHNQFHQDRWGFFGFFEVEEDKEVAAALVEAAAGWLGRQGCDRMVGPVNPSTNYECGLLIQGFDSRPTVMMTYNPPYYQKLLEAAGLSKAKDLYAYWSPVHAGSLERLRRFSAKLREREPKISLRPVNLKQFAAEVKLIQDIYNHAWEKNWGFVPTSDEEFAFLARELKPLVDPKLLYIAFYDGDPAGFLLALPDVNPALAALNGSLANPWRLWRAWWVGRRPEGLRLITMGVKEEYRLRGIEGVMFYHGLQAALERGYRWCEYSWILEDNELAKRTVRLMDAELKKIYRLFQKEL